MNILIVGGGKVGSQLAALLRQNNHRITLVEMNEAVYERLRTSLRDVQVMYGDGCYPQVLRDAGITSMDAIVATTGDDEDNLVIAKLAKYEFRVNRVIARVNNPKNEWLFTKRMGVDIALSHASMLARLIQEELSLGDLIPLLKLAGGKVSLVELTVPATSKAIGQRIDALRLPDDCVLVTVLRNGEVVLPRGETTISGQDQIVALIRDDQQPQLLTLFD